MVDRSRKGDPFIGLRPGFDAKLNHRSTAKDDRQSSESQSLLDDPFGSVETALAYAALPPEQEPAPWSAVRNAAHGYGPQTIDVRPVFQMCHGCEKNA